MNRFHKITTSVALAGAFVAGGCGETTQQLYEVEAVCDSLDTDLTLDQLRAGSEIHRVSVDDGEVTFGVTNVTDSCQVESIIASASDTLLTQDVETFMLRGRIDEDLYSYTAVSLVSNDYDMPELSNMSVADGIIPPEVVIAMAAVSSGDVDGYSFEQVLDVYTGIINSPDYTALLIDLGENEARLLLVGFMIGNQPQDTIQA